MIGFISASVTSSLNHTYYSTIADLHTLQSTVAHALGFPVITSHLLATNLNTETNTSNHYEVFLWSRFQSPWNLGTQLKLRRLPTPPAYDCLQTTFVVPYKPSVRTYRKHVTWLLSTVVWVTAYAAVCLWSRCLEMVCITPLFYCCKRVLLSNGCSCVPTVLAWS
jgi:hypothetical protein